MELYFETVYKISRIITRTFSSSFSLASGLLEREKRSAIYSIYGFVRLADEIVDTFHDFDKKYLLEKFEIDYYDTVKQGISLNPVLHAFHLTVKKYNIPDQYVKSFLKSMKSDLDKIQYTTKSEITEYIYGSADVIGLMCLKVFCNGDDRLFNELKIPSMKLGSAFQKINFLRDLKNDIEKLDRSYFPQMNKDKFDDQQKQAIIEDIEYDFSMALDGIKKLPGRSKLAVLTAYYYYSSLLRKIKHTAASRILHNRIRITYAGKIWLLVKAMLMYGLRII
jgi:15-cis-phytoene synthase